MTTTLDRIRALLVRDHDLPPERLGEDAALETLGVDSLGVMELLWNVEDDFDITLPTDRVELRTLGEVAAYVDGLVAEQHGRSAPDAAPDGRTVPSAAE